MKKVFKAITNRLLPIMIIFSSFIVFYKTEDTSVGGTVLFSIGMSIGVILLLISFFEKESKNDLIIKDDPELPESKDNGNLPDTLYLESNNSTANNINELVGICYRASFNGGWHTDRFTGKLLDRNRAEMLCLIHSEISEAMEGERKGLMDDHIPNRPMTEVELADAVIRIADYCGRWGYDLGGAIVEKLAYNATRADHKPENRVKEGGKKF